MNILYKFIRKRFRENLIPEAALFHITNAKHIFFGHFMCDKMGKSTKMIFFQFEQSLVKFEELLLRKNSSQIKLSEQFIVIKLAKCAVFMIFLLTDFLDRYLLFHNVTKM